MFVERSTQYTSFSPRKQPANAGTECKQFTENASVALQQPILTHAYTKCPPVILYSFETWPVYASNVFCEVEGGVGHVELKKALQKLMCPKTFAHHCSDVVCVKSTT